MLNRKSRAKIAGWLLFGVFSAFLFAANAAAQQSKIVEALDILGNRRLTDEEILQHIKTRPGERFDAERAQKDLQTLLRLGLFHATNTKVLTETGARGGVHVIFQIFELPLVTELDFKGLRYAAKEELLAELREQKAEIAAGSPYQPEKFQKARRVIKEYLLRKHGFVDAKVDVTEEEVSATTLKVSFVIDEKPDDGQEDRCEK